MTNLSRGTINARAPVRIDFGGGPTDVYPYPVNTDGFVINASIKKYAYAKLKRNNKNKISIISHDLVLEENFTSIKTINLKGPLALIKACIYYIKPNHGIDIEVKSEVPLGSGLGSSAAICIALIGVLRADLGENVPNEKQLVKDALYVENKLLKNINGGQDQYASAIGGFHSFIFHKNNIIPQTLDIPKHILLELEERSLLCYSGESHVSGNILRQIMYEYQLGDLKTTNALKHIRNAAKKIETSLLKGNLDSFKQSLELIFENQNKLHANVITSKIKQILSIAMANGAEAGKVAGAGGGGSVYLYCKPFKKQIVSAALRKKKFLPMSVNFCKEGVTIWFS
jgi:D-glycero-alpha-D-manno-heptose-7-phosphate kinase